jgi:division protein CdvB (Snf7/Vps24/ESCRT-III family)
MAKSRDQNAGESRNMKTENKSFERLKQFQNVGKTLRNQNSIQEKLRADCSQGMLAVIRYSSLCLLVCCPKI